MTLATIRHILCEAKHLTSVTSIAFEGGEPFLYFGTLHAAVKMARGLGFDVAIVTNGYWATSEQDAMATLRLLARAKPKLSVSCDRLHGGTKSNDQCDAIELAGQRLGLDVSVLRTANPICTDEAGLGYGPVMFRGRAAERLAGQVPHAPWQTFTACPHETLEAPSRIHIDPLGYLHVCQGISIGNVMEQSLAEICEAYRPESHPIVGPLLAGGPAELARRHAVVPADGACYADAFHLCYATRLALRGRFPDSLAPGTMYGAVE